MASAHFSQSPKVMGAITPVHQPEWIEIERPFAAFALSIPEAADVPASYAIRRHAVGNGRKDILTLGEPDSAAPFLRVEIYRPGNEIGRFADPKAEMIQSADALGPAEMQHLEKPLATKFGPLTIVSLRRPQKARRAVASALCAPTTIHAATVRLVLSGRHRVRRASTLACALDRLTLLSAGSEPKGRRAVRSGGTQSQLLRPARSDPGGDAEVSFALESAGESSGTAAHWALNTSGKTTAASGTFAALSRKAPQSGGALLHFYEHLRPIGPCSRKQNPATLR